MEVRQERETCFGRKKSGSGFRVSVGPRTILQRYIYISCHFTRLIARTRRLADHIAWFKLANKPSANLKYVHIFDPRSCFGPEPPSAYFFQLHISISCGAGRAIARNTTRDVHRVFKAFFSQETTNSPRCAVAFSEFSRVCLFYFYFLSWITLPGGDTR